MRVWSVLGVLVLVAACTLSKPDPQPTGPSPITGGEISVTSLDAVPAAQAPAAQDPAAQDPAAAQPAPAQPTPAKPAPETQQVPAEPPPPVMSPQEQACTDKGGLWGAVGKGGAACLSPTRDSGKQCRKESDCEGYCLARSGTCAPYTPMFGCNDIVQDNGVVVTLCID